MGEFAGNSMAQQVRAGGEDREPAGDNGAGITVRNDAGSGRYEAVLGGRVVGRVVYERRDGRVIIRHTIVDPAFQGRGVATDLVREVLDDLAANGWSLTNYCSFVTEFIAGNPGYARLIDARQPGVVA
jgi:hypothetical protein